MPLFEESVAAREEKLKKQLTPEDRIEIGQKMRDLVMDVLSGKYDHPNRDMSDGQRINLAQINDGQFDDLMAEAKAAADAEKSS
ncbi:MAG: hypothetical protein V4611_04465 [Patescibacteria group bacterium]